jgi:hypothetical protein
MQFGARKDPAPSPVANHRVALAGFTDVRSLDLTAFASGLKLTRQMPAAESPKGIPSRRHFRRDCSRKGKSVRSFLW